MTLVELMVAMVISLMLLLALVTLFVNFNRNNNELTKANFQNESGRLAIQVLQADLEHAGFWGGYIPQFDDLSSRVIPALASAGGTVPTVVPNPCLAFDAATWTAEYKSNLLGIPSQAYGAVPTGCSALLNDLKSQTDVLIVRHADTCAATSPAQPNCEASVAGNLYIQPSYCLATAQAGGVNTITLSAVSTNNAADYVGKTIRILTGAGSGQTRTITAYDGSTKVATVDLNWATGQIPDSTSGYSIDAAEYVFDTSGHTLTQRNCSTIASKYKYVSNIYYVRDYAVTRGDGIPTLMRSQFGLAGGATTPGPLAPQPLIEGIEGFRVEYGIDNRSDTNAAVNYTQAVNWADPENLNSPTNRGDGAPDEYVHCSSAASCPVDQLENIVTAKIYVLARNREATPGYVDNKTYQLGSMTLGPFNDHFKRHLFSSTVRLNNISGRRETP